MIRTIIVEDEYFPRESLKQKLAEKHPDIQVVADCENAETALLEILRLQPDLLFLDIQLPQKNGLWIAERLTELTSDKFTPPAVVFTTAYTESHYLLEAFRLAAIDYLVKPIKLDTLAAAIEKFKKTSNVANNLQNMLTVFEQQKLLLNFKNYGGLLLLKPEDISYIKADGNYVILYLADGSNEDIFERLGEIEKRLPVDIFIRIDRSTIINRQYIRQLNTKKSILILSTPAATLEIPIPENNIRELKKIFVASKLVK